MPMTRCRVARAHVTWTASQVDVTAPPLGPTRLLDGGRPPLPPQVSEICCFFPPASAASHYGNRRSCARRRRTVCHADGQTCRDNGVNLLTFFFFWHPAPTSRGLLRQMPNASCVGCHATSVSNTKVRHWLPVWLQTLLIVGASFPRNLF